MLNCIGVSNECAIMGFPELAAQYQIVLDRPEAPDVFIIKVELTEKTSQNMQVDLNALRCRILEKIHNITGFSSIIELVKPDEIPRTERKAKGVLNLRLSKI